MNTWNSTLQQISRVTEQLQDVARGEAVLEGKKRPPEGMAELYDGQRRGLEAGLTALTRVEQAARADGLHLSPTPQERVAVLRQQLVTAQLELIAQELTEGGVRPTHLTARYELHGEYRSPVVQQAWPLAEVPADAQEARALSERTLSRLQAGQGRAELDALLMQVHDPDATSAEQTWTLPTPT